MSTPVRLLLLCGSARRASTNMAMLRTVALVAPDGVTAELYGGLVHLPHFNADDDRDPLPAEIVDLRGRIAAADAVLISTPEYAGAMPGSFKNLLDWTVGGVEIVDKPVAWINTSPRGAAKAHASLRTVLAYTGAEIVESVCRRIVVPPQAVGADGTIADPAIRADLGAALAALAQHLAAGDDEENTADDVRASSFADLDVTTLYALLRLRSDVFVVEQECAYADMDGRDAEASTRHLWVEQDGDPVAYLRLLEVAEGDLRIGRVVTARHARGSGLGAALMRRALKLAQGHPVSLESQAHLAHWYERFGFTRAGAEYVEDGIPHVPMRRVIPSDEAPAPAPD